MPIVMDSDVLEVVIAFCSTACGGSSSAVELSITSASLVTAVNPLTATPGTQIRSYASLGNQINQSP